MATRTFLFVDQVRSTEQLTRLGDRAAQAVRRTLFQLLRQATRLQGGQEVDFTGDGLFCAFEGASEAVDAAVMMQELVASWNRRQPDDHHLRIRIGLNAGEGLPSEGGGYFGAAVVVGARLCAAAEDGQVLVSDVVRSLVAPQGTHRFQPAGAFTLKGVPEPVAGYAVAWTPDEREPALPVALAAAVRQEVEADGVPQPPALVGRGDELAVAARAWEAVQQGGRRLLLVAGDPGVGVTRFAAEVARAHGDGTVLHGAALGRGSRLSPWARALGDWVQAVPRAELALAVADDSPALRALVPGLGPLLPRPVSDPTGDDDRRPADLAHAIDRVLGRWSEREPVILVLDRLDQADPASLEVLRRLMESTLPTPHIVFNSLLAVKLKKTGVTAALARLDGVLDVPLPALSADDTDRLTLAVAGDAVDQAALRAARAESGGNPARAIRMALALRERALARRAADAIGRVAELRSDIRAQRAELVEVVEQLEQLRYDEADGRFDDVGGGVSGSPYKGLAAYQPEDAADFSGRELLVAELVAKLASSRFLAVVGPSGSGKSSVVRAGLIPALARESVPGSAAWVPVISTPAHESIADALRRGREQAHGQPIALFVDQFEELWTAGATGTDGAAAARSDALDLLVDALQDVQEQAVVVVSMRADYYGRTAEHPALASLMAESQILVPPMTPDELRRAIEAPARRAGLTLEQGLVQAAILDVGDGVGRLPLLSTAMFETWQRRRGSALTLAGYAAAGGARRAIATLAEGAYGALDEPDRAIARRIFLRLADPSDDGSDVARAATLQELGDQDEATRRVLDRLAERRLITVSSSSVQVAHEALLREWPRLRDWLDADREGRRLHHRIAAMAQEWEGSARQADALVRGARLTLASEWAAAHPADLTAGEQDFVRASEAAREVEAARRRRQVRRLQVLSVGLVVLLVLASVGLGFGLIQSRLANARANEATASELSAQAAALASTESDTALLLAVEGYRRDPSIDTEGGLLTALNSARFRSQALTRLPKGIIDTEVSRDGSTLWVLTASGSIWTARTATWDAAPHRLASGITSPTGIALSNRGALLEYGTDRGAYVIDARSGARVAGPIGGAGASGQFSYDDASLVTSTYPQPGVRVTDLKTGRAVSMDPGHGQPAIAVPSPTAGEFVAAPLFSEELRRYRLDGTPIGPPVKLRLGAEGASYSRNGRTLVVPGLDGDGEILDATTLKSSLPPFQVRGSRSYDAAFDPAGDLLAVGSDDGSVDVLDTATGRLVHRFSGLTGGVDVAFTDAHRLVAATTTDAVAFDLHALTPLGRSVIATDSSLSVLAVAAHPGHTGAVVAEPDAVRRLSTDLVAGATLAPATPSGATSAALSPDGRTLAVFDVGKAGVQRLELTTLRSGAEVVDVPLPQGETPEGALAFSPDGRRVAVRVGDAAFAIVDVARRKVLLATKPLDPMGGARAIGWSSDDSTVLFGGQSGVLSFVDARRGRVTGRLSLSPNLELDGVAQIDRGRLAAVSSEAGFVYLVDTRTHRLDGSPLSAGGTQLQNLAVSPDGQRIVAISRDGALRIWDAASRRAIGPALAAHDVQAAALAFTSDRGLISGDYAGGLVSWDLDPASWVTTACRLAGRDLTTAEWHQYLPDQPYRRTCSAR